MKDKQLPGVNLPNEVMAPQIKIKSLVAMEVQTLHHFILPSSMVLDSYSSSP